MHDPVSVGRVSSDASWLADRIARGNGGRQTNEECGAFALLRLKPDLASMFFHDDRIGEGEPLPGSLPDGLGREKEIEDMWLNCLRDAAARILNGNLDPILIAPSADGDF